MMNAKNLISAVVALIALGGMDGLQVASAKEYVTKAQSKKIYQAPLPGVEGKEMTVMHISAPPNFVGGKHMHPGPVFVYVLEGELTIELADGTKTFAAGELYAEEINAAMIGKNLSGTDDLKLLIFQVGDIGKPMMIKVE